MAQKTSFRLRFTFWLDMLNTEEQALGDYVEELKSQRRFVQTVRDGLRLIKDLRAGNTKVLLELFPLVKAQLAPPPASNDTSDIKKELDALKELLRSATPQIVAAPRSIAPIVLTGNPRPLEAPKFDLPRFDDDDGETLVFSKDTRTDSAQNFLNSMLALQ